jgi:hypothetical protein
MVIVGVDPGGQETGIVVRCGDTLLDTSLLRRDANDTLGVWVRSCVNEVERLVRTSHASLVAVESIVQPTWHVRERVISIGGLLWAQAVVGGLLVAFPDAILVPPNSHGVSPLGTYPRAIVGPNERRGCGKARHLRSAWDIAAFGERMVELAQRGVS